MKVDGDTVDRTLEVLRRRVDQLGVSEPSLQRSGDRRVIVELPGVTDPDEAVEVIGKTAQLTFHPVLGCWPRDADATPAEGELVLPDESGALLRLGPAAVTGNDVGTARATLSGNFAVEWQVEVDFRGSGAGKWTELTGQAACAAPTDPTRRIAIVLDDRVVSSPAVGSGVQCDVGIAGGTTVITGDFTQDEAKDLALLIRAGALPVPVVVVEQRTIGPTLGDAAIRASAQAAVIGALLTIAYMVVYYRLLGVLAALALALYGALSYAVLLLVGATLTLPGIAGFVLAIGMAVDANVLVFERIKEERAGGRHHPAGGRERVPPGVDGHRRLQRHHPARRGPALLPGVGRGPGLRRDPVDRRGGVGVHRPRRHPAASSTSSCAPACATVRSCWGSRSAAASGSGSPSAGPTSSATRDGGWPARRWPSPWPSAGIATQGLQYGLDFSGGQLLEYDTQRDPDLDTVRRRVADVGFPRAVVQASGDGNVTIRTGQLERGDVERIKGAVEEVAGPATVVREEFVGPTIGNELRRKAAIALGLALVAQLAYLAVRFRWTYGAAAVGAMFHDVVLLLGVFAWLGKELDGVFIAALLTVIGYSVNDSVVVFDRIRELRRARPRDPLREVANDACLQTVPRTINTGLGALFILVALYAAGRRDAAGLRPRPARRHRGGYVLVRVHGHAAGGALRGLAGGGRRGGSGPAAAAGSGRRGRAGRQDSQSGGRRAGPGTGDGPATGSGPSPRGCDRLVGSRRAGSEVGPRDHPTPSP